jgi:hypothetical protein
VQRNRLYPGLAAAGIGVAALFVTTGVSLVPTWLAVGPCLRDWTSPVSYRARTSPLATERFSLGGTTVQLCYGRPSMRGRRIFGTLVPYDSLWRLGANEPTRLYTSGPVTVAGILLEPGRYALYTIPHADGWTLYVSRSVLHWGNDISAAVRAREVGNAPVPIESLAVPVETLTVHARKTGGGSAAVTFEWETLRATVEVVSARAGTVTPPGMP